MFGGEPAGGDAAGGEPAGYRPDPTFKPAGVGPPIEE